ncbi:hypothetical protein Hamer_G018039, partial [Homarus americanus]
LVSACSLFNTSRNFQIFGWNEVIFACIWLCHPSKELLVRGSASGDIFSFSVSNVPTTLSCGIKARTGRIPIFRTKSAST